MEYTLYIRDITRHLKLQDRLKKLAYHDPLTDLFNRTYFLNNLKQRVSFHRGKGGNVVLMFLDLDQFKKINDNLGHKAGDELLCEVAQRLIRMTRETDMVGRWGGDEFVVALSGNIDLDEAQEKAEAILNEMRRPIELLGQPHIVPTSIGIAISKNSEFDVDKLMQYADIAMYRAKQAGRDTYRVFDSMMHQETSHEFHLEQALPKAIENDEFSLYYQPKVHCDTGKIIGYESLIRWHHPDDGLIPPNDFIPVIEGSGLIIQVGEWVIERAIKQLNEWRAEGLPLLPVAVNISGHHLHSGTLPDFVRKTTERYQIPGELIELEITEGVLTGNTEESISAMQAIKATNIRLSVDDFGTGYSSLSYLKKFPIDVLKIDRAFIRECDVNREDAAICKAIITLGKSLGLDIIAEGVETQAQLEFLRKHQCEVFQGFLYSRPLPADQVYTLHQQATV
jgi:Amt family ammonium transporter